LIGMLNRLSKVGVSILMSTLSIATIKPVQLQAQPTTKPTQFILGADISTLTQVEQRGGIFRDNGKPDDAIAIFTRHGWNCFRLRIFVNPDGRGGVINSLEYTRELAKRIKASGAVLLLDFHYSDTWADPQHQIKPAAWKNMPFDELEREVEKYTAGVMTDLKAHDALPDIVQVGNEIVGGTLWPDAQVAVPESNVKVYDGDVKKIVPPQPYDDAKQWARLVGVLKAGARGVRSATTPADRVRIMIHIDCGGDWPVTQWFFDHLEQSQVDYDMIGQSYYPNWHGTLDNVGDNLRHTAERYQKDIVVVETSYPWKNGESWSKRKNMAWPVTAAGQKKFMADLIDTVRQTPGGHGAGVVYWHPESVPGKGRNGQAWMSGAMALFDEDGNALGAVGVLNGSR
jgi:arabinogalactan endo-1,4-beta-galactosidase